MAAPRSRAARIARALGITRSSREPPFPPAAYWALAGLGLVVGVVSIFVGGRVSAVGWVLVLVGTPLMIFIARRPRV